MKNIEKIAIDTVVDHFHAKNLEIVNAVISSKAAVELAQQNFKKSAQPLMNIAKDAIAPLIADDLSEDAIKYMEDRISEIMKIPFKAKN